MPIGRKSKPTEVKRRAGNPGKRRLNADEPTAVSGLPECPAHLSPEAKAEWKRLGAQLVREQRMALVYKGILALYCSAWGRWVKAEKKLQESGMVVQSPRSGFLRQSPYLAIANTAQAQMMKALAELGITPTSQARVSTVRQPATVSRMQDFIKKCQLTRTRSRPTRGR